MKYLLPLLLLTTGCTVTKRNPTEAVTVEAAARALQRAEDKEKGVVCYRFSNTEGIACLSMKSL